MSIFDLVFLASVFFVLVCLVAMAASALLRSPRAVRGWASLLGVYVVLYGLVLVSVSLGQPRRYYPAGERRCYDDWCVAAERAAPANALPNAPCPPLPEGRTWVVQLEVSSVAKRVRQRATDARAELEDQGGRRYQPCSGPLALGGRPAHALSDALSPGESFSVFLPFQLPADAQPAGVVMHHGDGFPGVIIIAGDSSVLHRRALERIAIKERNAGW